MVFNAKKVAEKADMNYVAIEADWNVIIADDDGHVVYLDVEENDVGCFDILFLDVETPGAEWGFLCQVDADDIGCK